LSVNRLSVNGLSVNRLSVNRLSVNRPRPKFRIFPFIIYSYYKIKLNYNKMEFECMVLSLENSLLENDRQSLIGECFAQSNSKKTNIKNLLHLMIFKANNYLK
jgi:hypothetical protein